MKEKETEIEKGLMGLISPAEMLTTANIKLDGALKLTFNLWIKVSEYHCHLSNGLHLHSALWNKAI